MKLAKELAWEFWDDLDDPMKERLQELNLVPESWRFRDHPEFSSWHGNEYHYHPGDNNEPPPELDETLPVHPAGVSKKGKGRGKHGPKTTAVEISRWLKVHCFPRMPRTFSLLAKEAGVEWDGIVSRNKVKDAVFSAIRRKRLDPGDFHKFLLWDSWENSEWIDRSVAVKSYLAAQEMVIEEVTVPPRLRWIFQKTSIQRAIRGAAFHKWAGEAFLELAYDDGDAIRSWLQHAYAPNLIELLDGFLIAHQKLFPLPGRLDYGGSRANPEEVDKVFKLLRSKCWEFMPFQPRYGAK